MRFPGRRPRGFTLAEVLIAMALMGLIMTAAALAIQAAQTSYSYNSEKTELVARTRGVLDRVSRDLRKAIHFTVVDLHTLEIELAGGTLHTYAWNGTSGGNVTYMETAVDGVTTTTPTTLTGFVCVFDVTDVSPSCKIRLAMAGQSAASDVTIMVTPRKGLF
jgi:prepilin-type N-terminal cleavage/methylation domain-containing protein